MSGRMIASEEHISDDGDGKHQERNDLNAGMRGSESKLEKEETRSNAISRGRVGGSDCVCLSCVVEHQFRNCEAHGID